MTFTKNLLKTENILFKVIPIGGYAEVDTAIEELRMWQFVKKITKI